MNTRMQSVLQTLHLLIRLLSQAASSGYQRTVAVLEQFRLSPAPPKPTPTAPAAHMEAPVVSESALHVHQQRPHAVRNANHVHAAERSQGGFNERLAAWITEHVNTMQAAYVFATLAFAGLGGLLNWYSPLIFLLMSWLSQQFLQLVFLPILGVGQSVLSRKAELQADEAFRATMNTLHDGEQMAQHLSAQDVELLKQTAELLKQTPMLEEILTLLRARGSLEGEAKERDVHATQL